MAGDMLIVVMPTADMGSPREASVVAGSGVSATGRAKDSRDGAWSAGGAASEGSPAASFAAAGGAAADGVKPTASNRAAMVSMKIF